MGDEDDRRARAAPCVEELDDDALVGEIEREQGLVDEEQNRIADERLGDAQPLLLAAGEAADGSVGVRRLRRPREHRARTRALVRLKAAEAPAVAVEPQAHEVAPPERQVAVETRCCGT